jgi:hypothetical protein
VQTTGRLLVTGALLLALGAVYAAFIAAPSGPRSLRVFDPDRVADLEIDMWQAYYAHQNLRLFRGLVTSLHEQNRYPWAKAMTAGYRLARAAAAFADLRSNYEQVIPDLEKAYTITRDWTRSTFEPGAVARAELAWWVARRVPGQDSPEQVGKLIAAENALIYDVPADRVLHASVLRARAGRLRDEGGARADWPAVSTLLHQSYRELHAALADDFSR